MLKLCEPTYEFFMMAEPNVYLYQMTFIMNLRRSTYLSTVVLSNNLVAY